MPIIPKDKPNPGAERKHDMFVKKYFRICNRLIDKLQKGYDQSKISHWRLAEWQKLREAEVVI